MAKHIAILGAGLGWYVAAIQAALLGARVTVIESRARGGVCLNSACIPSKARLSVDDLVTESGRLHRWGCRCAAL